MNEVKKRVEVVLGFVLVTGFAFGESDHALKMERFDVWPEGKIPSVQTNQTFAPHMEWYTPKETKSDMVLISVSGGSYMWCGLDHFEVAPIRDYMLDRGVNVVTMRYRFPRPVGLPKHWTAWQDAQRTVRFVRHEAKKRGLNPEKIGFTGCSAGGHLTLMVATSSTQETYARIDEIDDEPCHVNFAIPVYPAYILEPEEFESTLDRQIACNDLNVPMMMDFRFDVKTPPMCFFHGDIDDWSAMGSLRMYHRLRTMGVSTELHIMAGEPHCFHERPKPGTPAWNWKDRVWDWFVKMGFVAQ